MKTLDDMDLKILRLLQQNGRRSFIKIGKELNVNEATVRKRVLTMRKQGAIKRFTVDVDPSQLGLNAVAIVGIEADPVRLLEIAQKLCKFEETKCVATSTGDHMIMTEVWAKDSRELTRLISEKLGSLDGVKRVCPAIILEKLKD